MIEPGHPEISMDRQCELIGLPRSSYYYSSQRDRTEDERLMRLIDEQYLKTPFYGTRRMTVWLRRRGETINRKRVVRLMKLMGLVAIYPKARKGLSGGASRRFPYLLRGLSIIRPDQVWATDITYIPMQRGFLYLVAVMDWYSRYVLSWRLSNTLDPHFCVEATEEALGMARPEIFNSDQGSQFTSNEHVGLLQGAGVRISMDGKGRVFDNIFVERLWRSVKYEEVYLKDYENGRQARDSLAAYWNFYNNERPHQGLGDRTPAEVYAEGRSDAEKGGLRKAKPDKCEISNYTM